VAGPILLCTDGSELAEHALRAGLALLSRNRGVVVVAVVEPSDPTLVTGSGMAGGVMSVDELETVDKAAVDTGHTAVQHAVDALGVTDAQTAVLRGAPGPAIVDYAAEIDASVIVIGTRGRGGVKRALLGSVSDHVVRNAPCPVVVTNPG
jgi:nucleotide-binding universal stress UspA family protein